MGYDLLAENWTVTSVPCSFWLIKEILIYCHCYSSVSRANRPRRQDCLGGNSRQGHAAHGSAPRPLHLGGAAALPGDTTGPRSSQRAQKNHCGPKASGTPVPELHLFF